MSCSRCQRTPCHCQHARPHPHAAGAVVLPAGTQIIQTPQAHQQTTLCKNGETAPATNCEHVLALLHTTAKTIIRSDGFLSSPCASQWAQAGMILWFPGLGYVEVLSVESDTIRYRNINVPEGVEIAAGTGFAVLPPITTALLSHFLCSDHCPCATETVTDPKVIVCDDGQIKKTPFPETVLYTRVANGGGCWEMSRQSGTPVFLSNDQIQEVVNQLGGTWHDTAIPYGLLDYTNLHTYPVLLEVVANILITQYEPTTSSRAQIRYSLRPSEKDGVPTEPNETAVINPALATESVYDFGMITDQTPTTNWNWVPLNGQTLNRWDASVLTARIVLAPGQSVQYKAAFDLLISDWGPSSRVTESWWSFFEMSLIEHPYAKKI